MAAPPSLRGGVHSTLAVPGLALATTFVGAPGVDAANASSAGAANSKEPPSTDNDISVARGIDETRITGSPACSVRRLRRALPIPTGRARVIVQRRRARRHGSPKY